MWRQELIPQGLLDKYPPDRTVARRPAAYSARDHVLVLYDVDGWRVTIGTLPGDPIGYAELVKVGEGLQMISGWQSLANWTPRPVD